MNLRTNIFFSLYFVIRLSLRHFILKLIQPESKAIKDRFAKAITARADVIDSALTNARASDFSDGEDAHSMDVGLLNASGGMTETQNGNEEDPSINRAKYEKFRANYEPKYLANALTKWDVPYPFFAVWDGDNEHYAHIFNGVTEIRHVHTFLKSIIISTSNIS
jgi:hypothetical protein